jgi:hypothetical protein
VRIVGGVKITVNGQEYDSWDEVPEETRALLGHALPDMDHNGVPDVFEGKGEAGHFQARFVATERHVTTRVPGKGARPAFRFDMTETNVRPVAPEFPDELADELPDEFRDLPRPTPAAPETPILLNGEPIGPDGQPLGKKHRWRR